MPGIVPPKLTNISIDAGTSRGTRKRAARNRSRSPPAPRRARSRNDKKKSTQSKMNLTRAHQTAAAAAAAAAATAAQRSATGGSEARKGREQRRDTVTREQPTPLATRQASQATPPSRTKTTTVLCTGQE
jgi:FKBP-type peptidyl-prolyl cis-trans isomerase